MIKNPRCVRAFRGARWSEREILESTDRQVYENDWDRSWVTDRQSLEIFLEGISKLRKFRIFLPNEKVNI